LHRDIKPANVLFDDAGAAHLSDFGVSHIADSAATVTSGIIGTLAYMAPEQRAGAPATVSSDIYGAGALLWHALTGAPPGADLPFISQELDERQRALAERLIAGPDRRPRDCVEARTELLSLDWPRQAPAARETRAADSVKPEASARLEPRGGPLHYDRLLERAIWVLAADPPVVERASAYARADHPLLACVLAYRPEEGTIWIDAVEGNSLSRPLDQLESARLGEALGALHRAGGSHGSVDRDHVVERNGSIILRFALEPLHPSADADLEGLRRLGVAK
jgi:serine/threonine-protein kinase